MAGGVDRGGVQPTTLHEPSTVGLVTEADVELKVVTPLLTGANFLEIPATWIKGKSYLAPAALDKAAGRRRGYFPDFSVWEKAFPLLIVEAKSPDVKAEVGYRESSLYARDLNQNYRTGVNPCSFILSTNGERLLAGHWDSKPAIDVAVRDLVAGSAATEKLRDFCHRGILAAHAARLLAAFRPERLVRPYSRAGDQALINSKKAFNSFAADLSPILRRYFTSASQNNNREIYETGYVGSDDITEYDRILEALLKDRIATRRGSLTQVLEPTRTKEIRLGGAITRFRQRRPPDGHMQLITGGVGTGKSLFARRYKELLQPAEQVESTHWSFIDFNTAPASLAAAENWLCERFIESFAEENQGFDPFDEANLPRIYSQDIQRRRGYYAAVEKASVADAARARADDIGKWQEDPQRTAFGICRYFGGARADQGDIVVVVMDNVDRLELANQLAAFQLALWFMDKSRGFVILQMRDETYERFKGQPPLDTFRTGVTFHIAPPRFLDVVKRRLELSLGYLARHTEERMEYVLNNGARIVYPNSMLGEFLKGIYLEIFERRHNISRVLQGIAGRDVRRALEMFEAILTSGHLSSEAITSNVKGAGTIAIPEYTVLKILMRTEYRFFSDTSGFISNIFYCDDDWQQPNNFLVVDILFWLCENRKRNGPIGLEGFFSVQQLADVLQLRGYVSEDVVSACSWLVKRQLIEADHMNTTSVELRDTVKVTASGFIHIRILSERSEYLYGVLSVTAMTDADVADQIADYIKRENQYDNISVGQKVRCVQLFLNYLQAQHTLLSSAYPDFGGDHTGSGYLIRQISSCLAHYRNPDVRGVVQPNVLDD
jgi:hypothetical protein